MAHPEQGPVTEAEDYYKERRETITSRTGTLFQLAWALYNALDAKYMEDGAIKVWPSYPRSRANGVETCACECAGGLTTSGAPAQVVGHVGNRIATCGGACNSARLCRPSHCALGARVPTRRTR
eukprot:8997525-Pyramimonas_sp.AAC.1